MTSLKEQLPTRVPEYFQASDEFNEYLEVCGEVLEEIKDSIRAFDFYKDYKLSSEKRLGLIASRFAFDIPSQIEESVLRGIVRDLSAIYASSGVKKTIQWVLKVLSWDADIEELWLIFPEKFQDKIREVYSDFYVEPGLESNISLLLGTFIPNIGETYRIGIEYQSYYEDSSRLVDGHLRIGENTLLPEEFNSITDPFSVDAGFAEFFDIGRVSKKNLVTGKSIYKDSGVYFQGRTNFSNDDNLFDLRILGEKYKFDHIRRVPKVMKTPYLSISINSDNYDQFVSGGEGYTESEKYRIAKYLIEFLLYDLFRPLNVKYISLEAPLEFEEFVSTADYDIHEIEFASDPFVDSNQYYFDDAPSYQHHDANMAILPPNHSNMDESLSMDFTSQEYNSYVPVAFQSTQTYNYTYNALTWTADSTEYVSTEVMQLRTPSSVEITTDASVDVEYRRLSDSTWLIHETIGTGTTTYEIHDVYEIRIRSASNTANVSTDITWLDQSSVELTLPLSPTFI